MSGRTPAMAEVNTEGIHISLNVDEVEALVEVLSDRVVWQDTDLDVYWQTRLHELFDALGIAETLVEVVT
ncbi:MAG: hypothetical protein QF577_10745 [Phycisphaerae bacterium]|nr:hypothetical protein [Phycisphaerae bacterium]